MTLTLLTVVFALPGVSRAGAELVGYIDDYSGAEDQYAIVRDKHEREVGVWAELLAGDQVRVKAAGQTLTVRYTDGTRQTFGPAAGDSESLEPRGAESSVVGNLLSSFVGVFADLKDQHVETVAAMARGDALALDPLNESGENVLVAGHRDLYLWWRGGSEPFSLTVTPYSGDARGLQVYGIETRSWNFKQADLLPGTFRVTIWGGDRSVSFTLHVVDEEFTPVVAPDCRPAATDEDLNVLLQAYCLAALDGGRWAFEASQLLAPVAISGYKPAELLLEGLRAGEYRYWTVVEQPQTDH